MNSAVDHLADTIKDLSQQLSKSVPKQYGQILKEYVSHHSINLAFDIGWLIFFLIVLIISAIVLYKLVKLYDEQGFTDTMYIKLGISVIVLLVSAICLIITIFVVRENIRDIIAPDYNMLYDIFYDILNATNK